MTNSKPTRRQQWRRSKIESERQARESKKGQKIDQLINTSDLGPQQTGRIISHYGANYSVQDTRGKNHLCVSRRNLPKLVCGDYVTWQAVNEYNGIIVALRPRESLLARPGYQQQIKPIAANIDQILVVIAPQPALDEDLINRYLVASALTNILPVIVLNKVDLLAGHSLQATQQRLRVYQELGYSLIQASTVHNHGMDQLLNCLANKTSIFVGQSGVGKSSLINAILPNSSVRVSALSHATGLGKHTTTVSTLYPVSTHGAIIDSPGIREFGLGHYNAAQIALGFVEFRDLIGKCKFNDCSHHSEPGCAVRQAMENGAIHRVRYESFLRLIASAKRH